MRNATYHPNANRMTVTLLVVLMTSFGIFAESHAIEGQVEDEYSLIKHAKMLIAKCDDTDLARSSI